MEFGVECDGALSALEWWWNVEIKSFAMVVEFGVECASFFGGFHSFLLT